MSPLFRRDEPADTAPKTVPAETLPPLKGQSQGKGRPTPKRKDASKRRIEPPANSKEARQRRREKLREERAERFEGARRGDDRYLLARDRGPVRRLVRDIIDSRRNVGPGFFFGVMAVVLFTTTMFDPRVRVIGNFVFLVLLVMLAMDAVIISRRIKKVVWARHPDTTEKPRSLYWYGVLRSISFRRLRNPSPLVKPGDEI